MRLCKVLPIPHTSVFKADCLTPGYQQISTTGDGNCFTNAFALLLIDFGKRSKQDDRTALLHFLNNNSIGVTYDDRMFDQYSKLYEIQISYILKHALVDYVADDLDIHSEDGRSNIHNIRLNMGNNAHHLSDQLVKNKYLKELKTDGVWLGIESIHFMTDMLAKNGIVYNYGIHGDSFNGLSVFGKSSTLNKPLQMVDPSAYYALFNPNAKHWTLCVKSPPT